MTPLVREHSDKTELENPKSCHLEGVTGSIRGDRERSAHSNGEPPLRPRGRPSATKQEALRGLCCSTRLTACPDADRLRSSARRDGPPSEELRKFPTWRISAPESGPGLRRPRAGFHRSRFVSQPTVRLIANIDGAAGDAAGASSIAPAQSRCRRQSTATQAGCPARFWRGLASHP